MSKNGLRMRALLWLPALASLPAFVGTGCGGNVFTSAPPGGSGGAAGSGAVSGRAGNASAGDTADGGDANGGSAGEVPAGGGSAGGTSAGGAIGVSGGGSLGGTGGSVSGSGGFAGGTTIIDAACPVDPPGSEPCVPGLTCTYGDDLRAQCRSRYLCNAGVWSAMLVKCAALIACIDVPEGFPKQGDACTKVGEDCTLDNGSYGKVYCRCDACTGATCPQKWECAGPPSGCPIVLPNEGQACDSNGLSCLYGSCSMANGLKVDCTKKAWRWSVVVCPVASN